jgi:hypothetical protein
LEGLWKEVIVANFEVLSQHLNRPEENHKTISQDSRSLDQDLKGNPLNIDFDVQ